MDDKEMQRLKNVVLYKCYCTDDELSTYLPSHCIALLISLLVLGGIVWAGRSLGIW